MVGDGKFVGNGKISVTPQAPLGVEASPHDFFHGTLVGFYIYGYTAINQYNYRLRK